MKQKVAPNALFTSLLLLLTLLHIPFAWGAALPQYEAMQVINASQITLRYSAPINIDKAIFELNGTHRPTSQTLIGAGKQVLLTFDIPFDEGSNILMSVYLRDTDGNLMTLESHPFEYYADSNASAPYGAVTISEVMPNPIGEKGLPEVEYIELYNSTDHAMNLKGWSLFYKERDNKTPLPAITIEAMGFAVLVREGMQNEMRDIENVIAVASMPTLLNTGSVVGISDRLGKTVSWFDYGAAEGINNATGISIELIDVLNLSNTPSNMGLCEDPTGGTPGRKNSIEGGMPDTSHPRVDAIAYDEEEIELRMSKPLDPTTALEASHYRFADARSTIESVSANLPQCTTVTLRYSSLISLDEEDQLIVEGLKDLSGHTLRSQTIRLGGVEESTEQLDDEPSVEVHELWESREIELTYSLPGEEWECLATIYNSSGKVLQRINTDSPLQGEGSVRLDIRSACEHAAPPAIGVLILQLTSPSYDPIQQKKPIILAR